MARVTVFTPTYNRANVLGRGYDSLVRQTCKDFEWLIVDDGSQDNTKELVEGFISEGKVDITYYYQENQGKHIATNFAVSKADSELFIIADSDDAFADNAIEVLIEAWDSIPEEEKKDYLGIVCRYYDGVTGEPLGRYPEKRFDCSHLDAVYKLKLKFEKLMMFRTEVLREFPFPGAGMGLKFFPETVIWQQMGRKYKARYIDDALRAIYKDQENALTHSKTPRFRENTFLWAYRINNTMDYFWYDPYEFVKAFVGLSRDNIIIGKSFREIMEIPNKKWKKAVCAMLYPAAMLLSLKHRK